MEKTVKLVKDGTEQWMDEMSNVSLNESCVPDFPFFLTFRLFAAVIGF